LNLLRGILSLILLPFFSKKKKKKIGNTEKTEFDSSIRAFGIKWVRTERLISTYACSSKTCAWIKYSVGLIQAYDTLFKHAVTQYIPKALFFTQTFNFFGATFCSGKGHSYYSQQGWVLRKCLRLKLALTPIPIRSLYSRERCLAGNVPRGHVTSGAHLPVFWTVQMSSNIRFW